MDSRVKKWLERDPDPETREELQKLVDTRDQQAIDERFAERLAFGTAGLRGVYGAGPSRINRLVVRETTAGLGAYLLNTIEGARERGVVVGYDARRGSRVFAEDTSCVLAGQGIKVFLTDRERPTPICPFAVKRFGTAAGVVITASHNPPEYNGYKVYWENGAQIIPPHDRGIAAAIERAAQEPIPWMDFDEALNAGGVVILGNDVVESYLQRMRELSIHAASSLRSEMTVAYTPLHGVGGGIGVQALERAGFRRVFVVPEQRDPDGSFPTVRFPNPEEPGAMDLVLVLAHEVAADLVFANDPDADRLAVAVPTSDGDYRMLTGDQVGALLGADILETATDPITVVTTIVSSRMLEVMAKEAGADYVEALTGFKWIVNQGLAREKEGFRFAYGYEEALGFTVGSLVPDKDGMSAMVAFAEMAAELRRKGLTVLDQLEALYRRYGLHLTAQRSLSLEPGASAGIINSQLRASSPHSVAGRSVESILDLQAETDSGFPKSDVLVYKLEGGARIVIRPSGTEPKIKCYYEICEAIAPGRSFAEAERSAHASLDRLIVIHQKELSSLI